MNSDEAVSVHSSWKMKLASYLRKPDGTLKAVDVASDYRCDLGKWIADEGAKFHALKQFEALREQHTRFHKAAADVVRRADTGEDVSADVALGGKSEFSHTSGAVVQEIMAMKTALRK